MSLEEFWRYYRTIERGTVVSLEEFEKDDILKRDIREAIASLYKLILNLSRKVSNNEGEDLIWDLAKKNIINPSLIQEYLDVIRIVKNVNKVSDDILYSMLVRIMEDLEQLYFSIIKFINN
ncbi:MAG: hypothetical protein RXQ80_06830 [Sulfolobaceae archaeon]